MLHLCNGDKGPAYRRTHPILASVSGSQPCLGTLHTTRSYQDTTEKIEKEKERTKRVYALRLPASQFLILVSSGPMFVR